MCTNYCKVDHTMCVYYLLWSKDVLLFSFYETRFYGVKIYSHPSPCGLVTMYNVCTCTYIHACVHCIFLYLICRHIVEINIADNSVEQ